MTHKRALLTVSAGIAGLAGVALATAGQTDTAQAATQTATITYKDGGTLCGAPLITRNRRAMFLINNKLMSMALRRWGVPLGI